MKKKLLVCLLCTLLLSGCGSDQPSASSAGSSAPNIEVPVSHEMSSEVTPSEEESTESSEPEETTEPEQQATSVIDKVINNNSFFVQADNKVYFRIPTVDALAEGAIYMEFMNTIPGSTLAVLNLDTDEITELSTDNNYGKLIICDDVLMTKSSMSDETRTYALLEGLDLRNNSVLEYAGEDYKGIDPSGDYVVVSYYDYDEYEEKYVVYKDGDYYTKIPNSGLYHFVGFCDGTVVYITRSEEGDFSLWSFNLSTEEVILLGTLPLEDDEYDPGIPEQVQVQNSMLYATLGKYEGTGHFYNGYTLLSADVHTENSVDFAYVPDGNSNEEFPIHAPRFTVVLGNVNPADGIPGTAEVNPDTGYIGYFDENGIWSPVAPGYGTVYSSDYEKCTDVEVAEYVDGYIYLIRNELVHTPENDIGWRTAYRRTETTIQRINVETGEVLTLAEVANY